MSSEQNLYDGLERLVQRSKGTPDATRLTMVQMIRVALPKIRDEAINTFIEKELPELLLQGVIATADYGATPDKPEEWWITPRELADKIAAKIAELRNAK